MSDSRRTSRQGRAHPRSGPAPGRPPGEDRSAREGVVRAGWERLRAAAEETRAAGREAPPGWDPRPGHDWAGQESPPTQSRGGHESGPPSLAPLLALLEALRAMVPRELEQQFTALIRELLLTIRALIDWYLERLDGASEEHRVEDIPIE